MDPLIYLIGGLLPVVSSEILNGNTVLFVYPPHRAGSGYDHFVAGIVQEARQIFNYGNHANVLCHALTCGNKVKLIGTVKIYSTVFFFHLKNEAILITEYIESCEIVDKLVALYMAKKQLIQNLQCMPADLTSSVISYFTPADLRRLR
jgi:hypothetical protein